MIRTLWVYLVGFVLTVRYGGEILLHSALDSKGLESRCRERPRRWARAILRAAGVEVELEDAEELARDTGQVVVVNHESWFDVFTLAAYLPVEYRFVAKKELEDVPIFGSAWQTCGHISIDREDRSRAIESLEEAGRKIREGHLTIVMFPEGTRSRTGELQRFKKGAFVLAIQAGVPVVPVGIHGSRHVMKKGGWRIRSGRIRIRVGEPIPTEGLGHEDRNRLTAEARRAVARLREEAGAAAAVSEAVGGERV